MRGGRRRGDHIVQSPGRMLGIAPDVRIRRVVRQLILEAYYVVLTLGRPAMRPMLEGTRDAGFKLFFRLARQYEEMTPDPVLDPAVAGRRDAPVEDELEVVKSPGTEEVLPDVGLRRRLEASVLDR